jgi:hypothetical protein
MMVNNPAKDAREILRNVVRLAELLDGAALRQMPNLPFLELAKAVSIKKPRSKLHLTRLRPLHENSKPSARSHNPSGEFKPGHHFLVHAFN